jgi:maltooligosyltrehalose synthase
VQIATLLRGNLAPPIGADVWREDLLPVPGEAGRGYENVFTGQRLTAAEGRSGAALRLAEVFSDFPVAALLAD